MLLPAKSSWAEHDTTDEETELGGARRAKRGDGWWGRGQPLGTLRKGVHGPVVDGGGLCSPGRWPIRRRVLPDTPIVRDLREVLWQGFLNCIPHF